MEVQILWQVHWPLAAFNNRDHCRKISAVLYPVPINLQGFDGESVEEPFSEGAQVYPHLASPVRARF